MNKITYKEIIFLAEAIAFNPEGLKYLNATEKKVLRTMLAMYSEIGDHKIKGNQAKVSSLIDKIIAPVGSGKVITTMKNFIFPDPDLREIQTLLPAALEKAKHMRKEDVRREGEASYSSHYGEQPPTLFETARDLRVEEQLMEWKGKQELSNILSKFRDFIILPDVKEAIRAECGQLFEDYAGTLRNITKKNVPLPNNPSGARRIYDGLSGDEKNKRKIEIAYGDLCMGLCKVFESGKRKVRGKGAESIEEKRAAARERIEKYNLGQMLFDILQEDHGRGD